MKKRLDEKSAQTFRLAFASLLKWSEFNFMQLFKVESTFGNYTSKLYAYNSDEKCQGSNLLMINIHFDCNDYYHFNIDFSTSIMELHRYDRRDKTDNPGVLYYKGSDIEHLINVIPLDIAYAIMDIIRKLEEESEKLIDSVNVMMFHFNSKNKSEK